MIIKHSALPPAAIEYRFAAETLLRHVIIKRVKQPAQLTLRWGGLHFHFLLLGGLLLLVHRSALSRTGRMASQFAIVILVYSLIGCWLYCNRGAVTYENKKDSTATQPSLTYDVIRLTAKPPTTTCPCPPLPPAVRNIVIDG